MKLKKPLPKWAPLAGIVAGGLLVLFAGWTFVVSPQNKKASDLKQQTASVQSQITQQLAAVAAAKATPPVQTIHTADVYKLATAMPSNVDLPDLLIELSQITRDSGVEVQSLVPGALTGSEEPISLTVAGDFYSITDLLYRLRNSVFVRNGALEATGRLFSIQSVAFNGSGGKLTATIAGNAYVYTPPAAPAPVVPAAGTDTTTTTPTDTTSGGGPSAAGAP